MYPSLIICKKAQTQVETLEQHSELPQRDRAIEIFTDSIKWLELPDLPRWKDINYIRQFEGRLALEAFSTTLRNKVDLSQLREHLLNVVQESMQPAHVSLWLRHPTGKAPTEEARVIEQSAGHDM